MPRKEWSVIVTSNYRPDSVRFTLPLWIARLLAVLAVLLALVAAATIVLAFSGSVRLARLSYLESRNRELESEFAKVGQLRRQLAALENQSRKMAAMLGVEKTPPPVDWESAPTDSAALPEWVKGGAWGSQPTPVFVPVEDYAVSQRAQSGHEGIDLAAAAGEPVRATADGVVLQRGNDRNLGRFLLLVHGQGYESYYAHLEDWNVDKGDTVRAGMTIGWVGSTGKSTAPHLHFEIRKDGKPIDPATALKF